MHQPNLTKTINKKIGLFILGFLFFGLGNSVRAGIDGNLNYCSNTRFGASPSTLDFADPPDNYKDIKDSWKNGDKFITLNGNRKRHNNLNSADCKNGGTWAQGQQNLSFSDFLTKLGAISKYADAVVGLNNCIKDYNNGKTICSGIKGFVTKVQEGINEYCNRQVLTDGAIGIVTLNAILNCNPEEQAPAPVILSCGNIKHGPDGKPSFVQPNPGITCIKDQEIKIQAVGLKFGDSCSLTCEGDCLNSLKAKCPPPPTPSTTTCNSTWQKENPAGSVYKCCIIKEKVNDYCKNATAILNSSNGIMPTCVLKQPYINEHPEEPANIDLNEYLREEIKAEGFGYPDPGSLGVCASSPATCNPTCDANKTKCVDGKCVCNPAVTCCGIKLNTTVPFIGSCIQMSNQNSTRGTGGDKTTYVNPLNAFPVLMGGLSKIMMTVILIMSFIAVIAGGVMMASEGMMGSYSTGKGLIIKVLSGLILLGASGIILRLINPHFFG